MELATPHLSGSRRRAELITAALAIIGEHGSDGLTTQSLSQRVGLVPSAIYRHFRDMAALLDAAIEAIFARLEGLIAQAEEAAAPGLACVQHLFHAHLALIRDNPGIPMLIFSREGCAGTPQRQARVLVGIQGLRQRVAAMLRRAIEAGEIDPAIDVEAGGLLYLGMVQPAALLQMLGDDAWNIDHHGRLLWPRFCAALGAREVSV